MRAAVLRDTCEFIQTRLNNGSDSHSPQRTLQTLSDNQSKRLQTGSCREHTTKDRLRRSANRQGGSKDRHQERISNSGLQPDIKLSKSATLGIHDLPPWEKTPTIRKKTSTEGGKGKYFCGTNTNMSFVRSSVRPRG